MVAPFQNGSKGQPANLANGITTLCWVVMPFQNSPKAKTDEFGTEV
jgi:hypothetical protein